jgi:hypothetical protein
MDMLWVFIFWHLLSIFDTGNINERLPDELVMLRNDYLIFRCRNIGFDDAIYDHLPVPVSQAFVYNIIV